MRLRRALPLLLAPALAVLSPLHAHADPLDQPTQVGAPTLTIGIAYVTGGVRLCFNGTAHVVSPWTAHVAGTRTTTNSSDVAISYDYLNPGSLSVAPCWDLLHLNAVAGVASITFSAGGGSGGGYIDRPASVGGVIAWGPGQPDTWVVTGSG